MTYDLFVSHASEDKEIFVQELVKKLEDAGIYVWYDEKRIYVGDNFIEKILEGLENSTMGIVVLSKNLSNDKFWPIFEAASLYSKAIKRKIIPLLYGTKEQDIPTYLKHRLYLDLSEGQDIKWDIVISKIKKSLDDAYSLIWETDTKWILYKKLLSKRKIDLTSTNILQMLETFIKIWTIDKDISIYKAIDIISCIPNNNFDKNGYLSDDKIESVKKVLKELGTKINKLSGLNTKDSERKIIDEFLISLLNKYVEEQNDLKPKKIGNRTFEVIKPTEFSVEDLQATFKIEKQVLRSDLVSNLETIKDWYYHNNYTFVGIRNIESRQVAAFITALPITDRYYKLFLSGEVTDVDVPLEDIRIYEQPGSYKLYLSSVCINPLFVNIKNPLLQYLYECFINMLLKISLEKNVFISYLIAEASCDDCVRLMKILNIDIQTETKHETLIYTSKLISSIMPSRSRYENILAELYNVMAPI